jgi:hypothetical protein
LPCKNQTYGSEKRICNCRRTTTRQCVCKASKAKLHRWIDLPAGRRRRRRRRTSEVTACSGWVNTSYAATLPIIPSVHRQSIYHRWSSLSPHATTHPSRHSSWPRCSATAT